MRTIKFRGIAKVSNEWVYGGFYISGDCSIITHEDEYGFPVISNVYPDSVGQLTGATDSKKREIYEGDIIECEYYPGFPTTDSLKSLTWRGVVEYGKYHTCFSVYRKDPEGGTYSVNFGGSAVKRYEVIGNVYSNPERLKEAANGIKVN